MAEQLRAFLRGIGPGGVRAGVAMLLLPLLLLVLMLGVIWYALASARQEAAEQQPTKVEETPPESRAEDFPLIFGPGGGPEPATGPAAERRSRGVPGVSDMDIVGYLQHIPGTNFRCSGVSPKRVCRSSSEEPPASHEVAVVSDAGAVLSVVATARDAPDEEAARVLGEVAKLVVGGLGPLDPETWIERTISSGGQYLAPGAEVRTYGTEGARTLEIVATGAPAEEPPGEATSPKTDQAGKEDTEGKATGSKKGNSTKADER